jgi:hypothetical protein
MISNRTRLANKKAHLAQQKKSGYRVQVIRFILVKQLSSRVIIINIMNSDNFIARSDACRPSLAIDLQPDSYSSSMQ